MPAPAKLLSVLAGMSASLALSQTDTTKPPRPRPEDVPRLQIEGAPGPTEGFLALCLIDENKNEVALAEIAASKSTNDSVKRFAQMMIQDHKALIGKLQMCAPARPQGNLDPFRTPASPEGKTRPGQGAEPPRTPRPGEKASPGTPAEQEKSAEAAPGPQPLDQLTLIKQEVARQCLASAKKELEGKNGKEFDKCYMAGQAFAHAQTVDAFTVYKDHTSGQLKQVVTEALPKIKSHLEQAKSIVRQLEGGGDVQITPASSREKKDENR